MQLDEIEDMKDQPIYVYCRSGNRSGQACLILETAGFTNTINVAGGMLAWQERITK
jgi:rhodanese-related sulfurtransferase